MTSELDVDRVLEDWFAQGPSRLPDRVISETVEHLDHIKRRRYLLSPGRERMARLLIAGTGLAAALIAAVVGFATLTGGDGIGGPDGVTYISDRHGYSVFLPDGWTVEERPGTWDVGEFFDANSDDGVDYFEEDLDGDGVRPSTSTWQASRSRPACRSTTGSPRHDVANDGRTAVLRSCRVLPKAASSTARPRASRPITARTSRSGIAVHGHPDAWSPTTAAATPSTSGRRLFPVTSSRLGGHARPRSPGGGRALARLPSSSPTDRSARAVVAVRQGQRPHAALGRASIS